jgi:hypothetical protein
MRTKCTCYSMVHTLSDCNFSLKKKHKTVYYGVLTPRVRVVRSKWNFYHVFRVPTWHSLSNFVEFRQIVFKWRGVKFTISNAETDWPLQFMLTRNCDNDCYWLHQLLTALIAKHWQSWHCPHIIIYIDYMGTRSFYNCLFSPWYCFQIIQFTR